MDASTWSFTTLTAEEPATATLGSRGSGLTVTAMPAATVMIEGVDAAVATTSPSGAVTRVSLPAMVAPVVLEMSLAADATPTPRLPSPRANAPAPEPASIAEVSLEVTLASSCQ